MKTRDGVRVAHVIRESSGAAVGLKPFDRLLSVAGTPVSDDLNQVHELLASLPAGAKMPIEVDRAGERLRFEPVMAAVGEPNVRLDVVDDKIVATIRMFRTETCNDLRQQLAATVKPQHIRGLVLNLRGNPGGRTDEAVCISSLFIGRENVFGEKHVQIASATTTLNTPQAAPDQIQVINWQASQRDAEYADLPLVVLVDQLSASASEIVAGALQDHQRAWIVGETSFGKGSVQKLQPYPPNLQFRIGFTTALFYRPSGTSNELVGVTPDFLVPFRADAAPEERAVLREAELNPGAIPAPEILPPWTQPRPEAYLHMQTCLSQHEFADDSADYQQDFALTLLKCQMRDQRPETNPGEYTNI